jgi:hypothetical protein
MADGAFANHETNEVRVNLLDGQISRSALAFCRRSLLLVGALAVFAASADAQVDHQCAEAASLWIPSSTSPGKTVVKWSQPIKYDILRPQDDNADFKHSIEEPLHFLARESGLKVEVGQGPDLSILRAPDISTAASNIRKYVENFFNDVSSSGSYRGRERVEIDPARWEAKHRSMFPKCYGLNLTLNSLIVRAFVLIQRDESIECVNVGFGELFGLMNIREYYVGHDRKIPTDLIAAAMRTLYDKRVIAGSSQAEAEKAAGEVCK